MNRDLSTERVFAHKFATRFMLVLGIAVMWDKAGWLGIAFFAGFLALWTLAGFLLDR